MQHLHRTYTVIDNGEEVFKFRGFVGVYSVNGEGEIIFLYIHDGKIAPTDYTTRAEVAVLIKRILDYTK